MPNYRITTTGPSYRESNGYHSIRLRTLHTRRSIDGGFRICLGLLSSREDLLTQKTSTSLVKGSQWIHQIGRPVVALEFA